jgi:hypothetical protein
MIRLETTTVQKEREKELVVAQFRDTGFQKLRVQGVVFEATFRPLALRFWVFWKL